MRLEPALIAGALLTTACGPPVGSDGRATIEIETAVQAFFAAYEAGDADSVVSFFTEDAYLMPPGAPTVRGDAELAAHIASGMELGRWVQSTTTDTLVDLGDNAVQVGTFQIRFEPTDATPAGMEAFDDDGRYVIHWARVDGRWKMAHYIANRTGS